MASVVGLLATKNARKLADLVVASLAGFEVLLQFLVERPGVVVFHHPGHAPGGLVGGRFARFCPAAVVVVAVRLIEPWPLEFYFLDDAGFEVFFGHDFEWSPS